mmetsp:Transcript_12512/g.34574  ORF Transcript_12512/g.34574 Transcript_12512/m.34574 type:complete len:257 (-) Transcript_12512:309-1079(-)
MKGDRLLHLDLLSWRHVVREAPSSLVFQLGDRVARELPTHLIGERLPQRSDLARNQRIKARLNLVQSRIPALLDLVQEKLGFANRIPKRTTPDSRFRVSPWELTRVFEARLRQLHTLRQISEDLHREPRETTNESRGRLPFYDLDQHPSSIVADSSPWCDIGPRLPPQAARHVNGGGADSTRDVSKTPVGCAKPKHRVQRGVKACGCWTSFQCWRRAGADRREPESARLRATSAHIAIRRPHNARCVMHPAAQRQF